MRRLRAFSLTALLGLWSAAGCTLTLNYEQCNEDKDCEGGGVTQFCTSQKACVNSTPEERLCKETYGKNTDKAIRLGALVNIPAAGAGGVSEANRLSAMKQAIDDINLVADDGLVNPVFLTVCNIAGSAADTANSMRLLAEQQTLAVVGPNSSQTLISVAEVAASFQIPLLSLATADSLSMLASRSFVFLAAPPDGKQGAPLARIPMKTGVEAKVTVVNVQNSYGEAIRRNFTAAWKTRNPMNNVDEIFSYTDQNLDKLKDIADALKRKALEGRLTDLLIISNVGNAPEVFRFFKDVPSDVKIYMTDTGRSPSMLQLGRKADEALVGHFGRMVGVSPQALAQTTDAGNFAITYKGRNMGQDPTEDLLTAYAYDAIFTAAIAAESVAMSRSQERSGTQVASALRRLNGMKNVLIISQYLDAAQRLQMGDATLSGVSGTIRFDMNGIRESNDFDQWNVDFAKEPATGEPQRDMNGDLVVSFIAKPAATM